MPGGGNKSLVRGRTFTLLFLSLSLCLQYLAAFFLSARSLSLSLYGFMRHDAFTIMRVASGKLQKRVELQTSAAFRGERRSCRKKKDDKEREPPEPARISEAHAREVAGCGSWQRVKLSQKVELSRFASDGDPGLMYARLGNYGGVFPSKSDTSRLKPGTPPY